MALIGTHPDIHRVVLSKCSVHGGIRNFLESTCGLWLVRPFRSKTLRHLDATLQEPRSVNCAVESRTRCKSPLPLPLPLLLSSDSAHKTHNSLNQAASTCRPPLWNYKELLLPLLD